MLRLVAPGWDAGIAAHPDERFLLGVAQDTPLWGDPCTVAPGFAYGHLPVYIARLLVLVAPGTDPLFAARLFSGLVGVLIVTLTGALGLSVGGRRAGLCAAAIMAVAPFPIQQAHFYTVDPLGTLLAAFAILFTLRRKWWLSGIFTGLAIACKVSLVWVSIPVWMGAAIYPGSVKDTTSIDSPFIEWWRDQRKRLLHLAGVTLLAFALASPWSLLRPLTAWRGPVIQASMVAGKFDFPYTRQYAGTAPFLYPLVQMALWGLGLAVTFAGGVGITRALWQWRTSAWKVRVALIWTVSYFLLTAGVYVKFPRYLLPIYPIWVTWAVTCLPRTAKLLPTIQAVLFLLTLPLGIAQLSLYTQPHPWAAASRWIYANLLPTETVAVEHWDHALPVPLPEGESWLYKAYTLPVFDEESPGKASELRAIAQDTDVIILASRRGYGALSRQPERYAQTLDWYRQLFAERRIITFSRCPHLGPLAITDDPLVDAGLPVSTSLAQRCGTPHALRLPHLDESFRVYDAPLVTLLVR